jgi:glycosyltransferase involved in cell wall biosynthesis
VSEKARQSFAEVIGHKEKTATIYNMIPTEKIIKKSLESCPWQKRKFTIITVGRLIPDKRQDRLLVAVKKLKEESLDFDVLIVGSGRHEIELKKYCDENKIDNVIFTGMQTNPYSYMRNADLFVLSSFREGFALVIPEAMTCGLPVLSTSCTGPTEILQNGEYGILVENSSEGVYNGLKYFLEHRTELEYFRNKSMERCKDFDANVIVDEIINLF